LQGLLAYLSEGSLFFNYPFEVDFSYTPVLNELPKYPEGIHEVLKRCQSALAGISSPFIQQIKQSRSSEDSEKLDTDVVLIMVTHGWCFNVIQEACSKSAGWKEAGFCAVSRAKWIPKEDSEGVEGGGIPDITVSDVNDTDDSEKTEIERKNEALDTPGGLKEALAEESSKIQHNAGETVLEEREELGQEDYIGKRPSEGKEPGLIMGTLQAGKEKLSEGSDKASGAFHQAQADYYGEKARNEDSIVDSAGDRMNQGVEKVKAAYYNATGTGHEVNADVHKDMARGHAEGIKDKVSDTMQSVKNTFTGRSDTSSSSTTSSSTTSTTSGRNIDTI